MLAVDCAPVTWPIGMGRGFRGIYHMCEDAVFLYRSGQGDRVVAPERIDGLMSPEVEAALGADADALREEVALVRGASHAFDLQSFLEGHLTPVYFGTALGNFGVRELLDDFVEIAPVPKPRPLCGLDGVVGRAVIDYQHLDRVHTWDGAGNVGDRPTNR